MNMTFLPSKDGFLGLSDSEACSSDAAKAWILPCPLEASVSYEGGTAAGPQALLTASHQVELFDESFWCEPIRQYGVATLTPPAIKPDLKEALAQVEDIVASALNAGKFPLILGGEHALTAGAIRPFAAQHEQLTILQFDAHADLRDGYDGEHYSHAAAMRRCLDHDNIRLVSVGIRNISAEEIPFLDSQKDRIDIFWAKDKTNHTPGDIAKTVGNGPVYITFDLDGFDSALMPATGTPEPGGLFWHETMEILDAVCTQAEIVGADIVELAPRPGLHACDFLAAKLAYKILSYALIK